MARARAITFVSVVLLGASGPAFAPLWSPAPAVLAEPPSPCAPQTSIEIELGCPHRTAPWFETSFLDTSPLPSPLAIESAAEPLARGEALAAADAPSRVPEPTSLLLLLLGLSAFGVASRAHPRGVVRTG